MSTTDIDYSIDTAAINAKYAKIADDPRRLKTGTFTAPVEVAYRSESFKRMARAACSVWIDALKKQGWDLISPPKVYGPRKSYDLDTNILVLDRKEYLIKGIFMLASTPRTERIEIPPGLVKRDVDHVIGLDEATKATR